MKKKVVIFIVKSKLHNDFWYAMRRNDACWWKGDGAGITDDVLKTYRFSNFASCYLLLFIYSIIDGYRSFHIYKTR